MGRKITNFSLTLVKPTYHQHLCFEIHSYLSKKKKKVLKFTKFNLNHFEMNLKFNQVEIYVKKIKNKKIGFKVQIQVITKILHFEIRI